MIFWHDHYTSPENAIKANLKNFFENNFAENPLKARMSPQIIKKKDGLYKVFIKFL